MRHLVRWKKLRRNTAQRGIHKNREGGTSGRRWSGNGSARAHRYRIQEESKEEEGY